jgi:hypothetical protein
MTKVNKHIKEKKNYRSSTLRRISRNIGRLLRQCTVGTKVLHTAQQIVGCRCENEKECRLGVWNIITKGSKIMTTTLRQIRQKAVAIAKKEKDYETW